MQSSQRQYRPENEGVDKGRINYCMADLQRRVQHNIERRAWVGRRFVFAQAPENIFNVNDGIINDSADRDGEAAESNRVEGDSKQVEHNDGREQGKRYGCER